MERDYHTSINKLTRLELDERRNLLATAAEQRKSPVSQTPREEYSRKSKRRNKSKKSKCYNNKRIKRDN
jgi:hypothetical protein